MMAQLAPIPYRTALLDSQGLVTRPWQQWFEALLARVGGTGDVETNLELSTTINTTIINEQTFVLLAGVSARLDALETQGSMRVALPSVSEERAPLSLFSSVASVEALVQRVDALELRTSRSCFALLEVLSQRIEELEVAQIFQ